MSRFIEFDEPALLSSHYVLITPVFSLLYKRKWYSPAAALAEARTEGFETSVCATTLYSYIEKRVFLHLTNKDLWEKGRRKKRGYKKVQRIAHPICRGLWEI